jgi:hypothetical protein
MGASGAGGSETGRRSLLCPVLLAAALAAGPARALDCHTEIDPVYLETDVPGLIHAWTPEDVERIRADLVAYIWKSAALPADLPAVTTDVADPLFDATPPNVARIDELTVSMEAFVSRMYLYVPAHPRRRLMIFHQGHSDGVGGSNGSAAVRFFLGQRVPVLVVFMPMYGPNTAPWGPVPFFHWPMASLETDTLSPIRYFLEPIVRAVNWAERVLRIRRRVSMVGISGGGWTTTLSAAVDPRLQVSVSVAGSVPMYLRAPPCPPSAGTGDYEQVHPPLYAIANYLDLYVLAAHGHGRGHLQVFNQFDPCCFAGLGYRTYSEVVRDIVERLPWSGRYDVFLDSSHAHHIISQHALEEAIGPFVRRRRL